MSTKKLHLGGDKYLVEENYQVGGGRGRKKTQMAIHKLVDGSTGAERFLTKEKYRELVHKYEELKYKKSKEDNKTKYKTRNLERNMMDLVPPYQVNPAQRRLLEHILGVKNVSDIELFNTLVHAGLVNTKCPPLGEPMKSETYVDPITGRSQCRYPIPYRKIYEDRNCPDSDGDPFATEKYVDWQGKVTCRRPVIRGAFFCPEPGAPDKTRSVVMADGTGICMPEERSQNSTKLFPSQVMYPDSTNHKITMFESIFANINMNPELVNRLNSLFKSNDCLKDLKSAVEKDTSLGWLKGAVSKMRSNKDVKICNAALYQYVRKNMPHYFDNRYPSSTDGFLSFFGINSPRELVMTGGRRKRSVKRRPAKRRAAKRGAKSGSQSAGKPKRKAKRAPKRKPKTQAKRKGRKPSRKKVTSQSSSSAKSSF